MPLATKNTAQNSRTKPPETPKAFNPHRDRNAEMHAPFAPPIGFHNYPYGTLRQAQLRPASGPVRRTTRLWLPVLASPSLRSAGRSRALVHQRVGHAYAIAKGLAAVERDFGYGFTYPMALESFALVATANLRPVQAFSALRILPTARAPIAARCGRQNLIRKRKEEKKEKRRNS